MDLFQADGVHLEDYVDAIETKPALLVDDLPVTEIFPARIYLKENI